MFAIRSLRPLAVNWGRSLGTTPAESPSTATVSYGNPTMPDKLYKTIELEMKSAEPQVLTSYEKFLLLAAGNLGIEVGKCWSKKPKINRWTLLKSVHIYRKHMVQYEVRTHYKWVQFHKLTGSTADTFLEYVERMLPEGVALKVSKISIEPFPKHLTQEGIEEAVKMAIKKKEMDKEK